MPKIQGRGGVLFAGAWLGYGLHDDGFTSGLRAFADHIDGFQLPFGKAGADRKPCAIFVAPLVLGSYWCTYRSWHSFDFGASSY